MAKQLHFSYTELRAATTTTALKATTTFDNMIGNHLATYIIIDHLDSLTFWMLAQGSARFPKETLGQSKIKVTHVKPTTTCTQLILVSSNNEKYCHSLDECRSIPASKGGEEVSYKNWVENTKGSKSSDSVDLVHSNAPYQISYQVPRPLIQQAKTVLHSERWFKIIVNKIFTYIHVRWCACTGYLR